LSNPVANVDKYLTEKSQAINLGIYSSDLSYASTYRQQQETIDFMNASKALIDKLDISPALDKELLEAIENNLDNKDELVNVITNSFYNTYEYLNKNDRGSVSLLVIAGSWVEALYIATHISEETFSNKEMVAIIMEQKEPLNKLMSMLEIHAADADIQSTIEDLKILQEIFNSVDEGSITMDQLDAIEKNVAVLRDKYVS
jgi:lipopolysaccharide biosynthesis regulator YciM